MLSAAADRVGTVLLSVELAEGQETFPAETQFSRCRVCGKYLSRTGRQVLPMEHAANTAARKINVRHRKLTPTRYYADS